ncbi:activating transcription factor 7-interacting protein 1-like [Hypanus sabinus]|uniref:activating transcription factor 7-interacting protein 1-like n=1 Tax=Hypanus sabinus TaxID=79690 RepID=UPI0028C3D9C1|nr:activating transcription factor 7-interacting protein 1-like [Hypanus sabinus]XP_059835163.1 activating transcription factor 7-interacting protein 1-like [Hypanus sabinus]XP_059835164.1 activating transcription factor 7-interacting protein 1-like [Hypanus sabinus]XP_059835165.1 activating transcription factor 7-interacting protein 1-like [Hypanus sabinus]
MASIIPRKGFRAKKTLRVSDRQQWEALLQGRHHIENGQPNKECDNHEKCLQCVDTENIDGGKHNDLIVSKHKNNELPESAVNHRATFSDKNEVMKTKFKKSPAVGITENQVENRSLKSPKNVQTSGHLETKTYPQKKHHNSSLLKKNISSSSETVVQNKTPHGSTLCISSFVLKEDFNRASKTKSTKVSKTLNQKNYVKSIHSDKNRNVKAAFHIVDTEELISSNSNNTTGKLKKLKHSLVPVLEKLPTETQWNMMNNVQLSELRVTENINNKIKISIHTESQSSSVSKCHYKEKSIESKILTDDQDDIECTPIILKEMKTPDRAERKRFHSRREGKNKHKKIKISHDAKSVHFNLSCEKSTQTAKKITWEEVQKILHHKMNTELGSDTLGKKLEELTRRVENIDCTQKHEELAKSIQSRIKHLEKKVNILQAVNSARLRRNPEEPQMTPVSHDPISGANLKNAEPVANENYVDSCTVLGAPSDQKSQLLPYRKTSDSINYELNLQKTKRTSNSVPTDAKNTRNIPLPKNLDTVTPANTHCGDMASKTTEGNTESPDTLVWQPNRKEELGNTRQESNATSSQIIIDLTKGNEQS